MSFLETIKRVDTAFIGLILADYILGVIQNALLEVNIVNGLHSCFCIDKHLILQTESIDDKIYLCSYCNSCGQNIFSNEIQNLRDDKQSRQGVT